MTPHPWLEAAGWAVIVVPLAVTVLLAPWAGARRVRRRARERAELEAAMRERRLLEAAHAEIDASVEEVLRPGPVEESSGS